MTNTGLVREHNEDSFLAASPVFLVADGMGGHRFGDQASKLALSAFASLVGQDFVSAGELEQALAKAAISVDTLGRDSVAPGSTLTGLVLSTQGQRPCLRVVNIGDSRTYQLSRGVLSQVTKDHSRVQELIDAGFISVEAARNHPDRSVITRALGAGSGPVVCVDQVLLPASQGDRYLVCSDGLSGLVRDAALAAVLSEQDSPQDAAERLLVLALEAGGHDNITVLVVDVVEATPSWGTEFTDENTIPNQRPDGDTVPREAVLAFLPEEQP
ncbi:PP2C family protein-serine/threonine phosphatase [Actinomyces bovis]|uniref:PP2C family protein-serine/threonine phosphatase n=1 Tax=Actinomyces bovis TaxID=1658 RepID=UPI0014741183|nr:protein phosphatase 2C domain-containing protein [Actinomyces bovis]